MITFNRSAFIATTILAVVGVSHAAPSAQPAARGVGKIASVQNQVETQKGSAGGWAPSAAREELFERDRVRTGPASRAAILYSDQTLHRMSEKSEIEILPPSAGNPGVLRVLSGNHYFSSRTPKDYGRIETPTVTAAIKGTEFVVEVTADNTTRISMLEGVVEASNSFGSLTIGRGEEAYVEPGKAPVKRILVRPRDAVAWALYYPPVLGGSDAARLDGMGADGKDLVRAASLLSAGKVDEARAIIEAGRARGAKDPVSLALSSVIEVTSNRKKEGLDLAEQAVAADARSAAAALALSFAAQANFDIARARAMAEKAAELDPANVTALARAAELRMAEGDLKGARKAAERAVQTALEPAGPAQGGAAKARAFAVLGFVDLAQLQTGQAQGQFEKAVAADPGLSMARLGLGITRIRRGRVGEGREEIQTAALLDPDDSLLRSYLAKAYYEEKRPMEAGKELATAKELDPSDPTPYLYDAIRKQNENRPVEALYDLRESIARNDRRAVYRSRQLLDQDRAVRGSDLARVYNDLGFEQLGIVTARRSADEDQANYSSHSFLAGNYRSAPGFAPAFLSEVLQARIFQPVSVNAVRPDVVNESVSFNEYTALFDRPRARLFAGLTTGRTNTDMGNLFDHNPFFEKIALIDRSDFGAGEITGTLNGDRYAAALSYKKTEDDGFRANSDRSIANYRGFFEFAPTYQDSFQVNALYGRQNTGDYPLRFFVIAVAPERFKTDLRNLGLGYHRIISAGSDLAVSLVYNRTEQTRTDQNFHTKSAGILEGPQLEVQQVLRFTNTTWTLGAGGFRGDIRLESGSTSLRDQDTFLNGYAYAKFRNLGPLEITAGASVEYAGVPTGLLTPRDGQLGAATIRFSETRLSPKLGLSLYLPSRTTLRAAGYYRLSPAIGRIQTLEPTQVAGFNQFFFEPEGGTRSLSYGLGVDQEFGSHIFGGLSLLRRDLTIPEATCASPSQFGGCTFQQASLIAERESRDYLGSAYINAAIGKRVTASIDYLYNDRSFDNTVINNLGVNEDHIKTHRIRPQARFFLPCGFFASATGTYYAQEVTQFDDFVARDHTFINQRFWTLDMAAGYRLPRRFGSILLEARNLTDREFKFFERAIEDTVIPARSVNLSINFAY